VTEASTVDVLGSLLTRRDTGPHQSSAPLGVSRAERLRAGVFRRHPVKEGCIVATKAIVGEKVGMTQVWDEENRAIPVTVLRVAPLRVVQVKTPETDGYSALQVTWGTKRANSINQPEAGHFDAAGVAPGAKVVELRLDDVADYTVGQELTVELFAKGEHVDASATSKGKGFAGGMKRHNFKGQGASHGNHKHHRAPGSIGGCATPGRVFKGTKMAGRMGGQKVTTTNLVVVAADLERNLLLVKGNVPGSRGSVVMVRNSVKVPAGKPGGAK
jgi:large subunit ribosomal protein L3